MCLPLLSATAADTAAATLLPQRYHCWAVSTPLYPRNLKIVQLLHDQCKGPVHKRRESSLYNYCHIHVNFSMVFF